MKKSTPEPARRRRARSRVAKPVEAAILDLAFEQPGFGQDRVARELLARGIFVSASGVRYVWQRHDLRTIEKRIARIEGRLRDADGGWSAAQLAARERAAADRRSRHYAADTMGGRADSVKRGDFLLVIAARVFRERGFEATSLRDIARAARVSLGSLYYHYPSKDDLFVTVHDEGIRRLIAIQTEAFARARTPTEKLRAACATHLRQIATADEFIWAARPIEVPSIGEAARRRLEAGNGRYERIFRDIVRGLDLPRGVRPNVFRLLILGALNWASVWYRPGKASPDEIADSLMRALRLPHHGGRR